MSAVMISATVVLCLLAVPIVIAAGYLGALALLARKPTPPLADTSTRFAIVVPSHNEELGITATVESLLGIAYPRDAFSVVVIADNCRDATAARARAAGARVIERFDEVKRGKGFALALAYETLLQEGEVNAIVVVDADTIVSSNLLTAFSARIARGAEALQAEYLVRNPDDSWRTRLLRIAFTLFHTVRSLGRERLSLSCGLRGNGMCFATGLLRRVPADAYSVVEDIEYGITLGRAGVRVEYVAEAQVLGEMPASGAASASQRQRWEGGRAELKRQHGRALVSSAFGERNPVLLDLALDLYVPPLSRLGALSVLGTLVAAAAWWLGAGPVSFVVWAIAPLALAIYVTQGAHFAGVGPRVLLDLAYAPIYVLWKMTAGTKKSSGAWVRTTRNSEHGGPQGE